MGFIASAANEATPDIIKAFGRRCPGWRVEMRQAPWSEPTAGLSTGEVDVALLRLPFPDQDAYNVRVLLTEPRCVVLPSNHRLATRDTIAFEELWDEPFVAAPAETGAWRDYWLGTDHRPTPPRIGAVTDQPDAWLQAVANGYGIRPGPGISHPLLPPPRHHLPPGDRREPDPGLRGLAQVDPPAPGGAGLRRVMSTMD
nr:hypothetical protein GCM10017745_61070 [Saccharothrix mutabilis subsp. capreolus]